MFPTTSRKRKISEQVVPCTSDEPAPHTHSTSSSAARRRRTTVTPALAANLSPSGPFADANYPIPDFENVYNLMRHPQRGLTLADRRWRLLTYSKCFVGTEAVEWIVTNLSCERPKAITIGQRLMDAGIIHHVTNSEPFADEYYFYRFQEDDDTNILNMKRVWDTSIPTREAVDVAKDLLTRIALLCEEYRKSVLANQPSPQLNNPQPPASTTVNNEPITSLSNANISVTAPSTPLASDPHTSAKSIPASSSSSSPLLRQCISSPQLLSHSPLLQFPTAPFAANVGDEVDYTSLAKSERFRQYALSAAELQRVQLVALNHDERIAFFVNIYNTLCLHAYVVYGMPNSVLRRYTFFRALSYRVAGLDLTLDDIEHGILRGNKRAPMIKFMQQLRPSDPKCQHVITNRDGRIHFVISAGTRSDPPIRILDGDNVQEELHYAAVEFLSVTVKVDVDKRSVTLPRIFYWYNDDFPSPVKQLLLWVARYLPVSLSKNLVSLVSSDAPMPTVTYENFDWATAEARFNASIIRRKRRKLERERNPTPSANSEALTNGLFDASNGMNNVGGTLNVLDQGLGHTSTDGIAGLFAPAQPQVGITPIMSTSLLMSKSTPLIPTIQSRPLEGLKIGVPRENEGVASAVSIPAGVHVTDSSPIIGEFPPCYNSNKEDDERSVLTSSKSQADSNR